MSTVGGSVGGRAFDLSWAGGFCFWVGAWDGIVWVDGYIMPRKIISLRQLVLPCTPSFVIHRSSEGQESTFFLLVPAL